MRLVKYFRRASFAAPFQPIQKIQLSSLYACHYPTKTPEDPQKCLDLREGSLISIFKQCSNMRDLMQIHAQIIRTGFDQHVYVVGRMISFCCVSELGSMDYAASAFEEIQWPDEFLYNTMIRGFGRTNRLEEAFSMYKRMRYKSKPVDNFTFCFMIKICWESTEIDLGKQVHCCIIKLGLDSHVYVGNALIHMYSLVKDMETACKLFEELENIDLVSWNTLIDGYVNCGHSKEAQNMFLRMQIRGFRPDEATLVVVLSACSDLGNLDFGKWVHSTISSSILDRSISVSNSLIDMYAKCGVINTAIKVFEGMKKRNIVSWNSMISGLAMHGHAEDALRLFEGMLERNEPYEPNDITFVAVLCACSHGGLVEEGRKYFDSMQRDYGINPTIRHFGCMIDLLGRAGLVREAYDLIKNMPIESNAVVWRTLLGACRLHGDLELGEQIKKSLAELEPDHSSDYVLLSHMYASKDQWSHVLDLREVMRGRGVQKPQSGNSVINMLDAS